MPASNPARWQVVVIVSLVLVILFLLTRPVHQSWKATGVEQSYIVNSLNSKPLDYQQLYLKTYKPRHNTMCPHQTSAGTGWLYLQKRVDCIESFKAVLQTDSKPPDRPPRTIPAADREEYLLDGNIALSERYLRNVYNGNPVPLNWTKVFIEDMIEAVGVQRKEGAYGVWQHAVYNALDTADLNGLHGLVIGSEKPWVEAAILHRGAASVTTSEYREIIATHPRSFAYHPTEIARRFLAGDFKEYDFAASYSSIEHSGLGRYGDPCDPKGDIREVEKVSCLVKPDGLFFLGLPFNADRLVWNAHRLYGPVRLPLITANWEVLDVVSREPRDYTKTDLSPYWSKNSSYWQNQLVAVLKNKRAQPCN